MMLFLVLLLGSVIIVVSSQGLCDGGVTGPTQGFYCPNGVFNGSTPRACPPGTIPSVTGIATECKKRSHHIIKRVGVYCSVLYVIAECQARRAPLPMPHHVRPVPLEHLPHWPIRPCARHVLLDGILWAVPAYAFRVQRDPRVRTHLLGRYNVSLGFFQSALQWRARAAPPASISR